VTFDLCTAKNIEEAQRFEDAVVAALGLKGFAASTKQRDGKHILKAKFAEPSPPSSSTRRAIQPRSPTIGASGA
jgi:hypothetical protein